MTQIENNMTKNRPYREANIFLESCKQTDANKLSTDFECESSSKVNEALGNEEKHPSLAEDFSIEIVHICKTKSETF